MPPSTTQQAVEEGAKGWRVVCDICKKDTCSGRNPKSRTKCPSYNQTIDKMDRKTGMSKRQASDTAEAEKEKKQRVS